MKFLLIGGAGFIGSEIAARLLRNGHIVRVLDLNIQRFLTQKEFMNSKGQFEAISGDFADSDVLDSALTNVDVVIHLASSTVPHSSNLDPISDVNGNVISSLHLMQACRDRSVKKIVFSSSGGTVYGIAQSIPISEDHPTNPICSYGITKLMIEKYLQVFHQLYDLDYSILRCANAYGPRQNIASGQGVIGIFMQRMLMAKPIVIWGDGSVVRDYVYVGDVAEAYILAASSNKHAMIVNIGSGSGMSLNALISTIARVIKVIPSVEYSDARQFDAPNNTLNIDRAKQILAWSPKIELETGVELTWKWLREEVKDQQRWQ